jgi:hypothetical protein
MKRQHRKVIQVLVLSAFFVSHGTSVTAYVVSDEAYFSFLSSCDDHYDDVKTTCLSCPSGPSSQCTESYCRYEATSAYSDCLDSRPTPSFQLDFCSMARQQAEACTYLYHEPGTISTAYSDCRTASMVDYCE